MDKVGKHTLEVMKAANWYNTWLFDLMKEHISGEILEVGTGIGNFTKLLSSRGKVTGIDINQKYINILKKDKHKNIVVGYGDIEKGKYYFNNKLFDSIICLNVLEHIDKDKTALKNMFNMLNISGKLILLVPSHRLLLSEFDTLLGHLRRYSKSNLYDKLDSVGFKDVNIRYINWWAAIGWFIFVKLLGRTKIPKNEVGIFNTFGKFMLWPEKFMNPPFGLSILAVAKK